jgi:hypothetical protein
LPLRQANSDPSTILRYELNPAIPKSRQTSFSGFRPAPNLSVCSLQPFDRWNRNPRAQGQVTLRPAQTNPVWYAEPALYETREPWYFQITNREYADYDSANKEQLFKNVINKIRRADIIAALANLAANRTEANAVGVASLRRRHAAEGGLCDLARNCPN